MIRCLLPLLLLIALAPACQQIPTEDPTSDQGPAPTVSPTSDQGPTPSATPTGGEALANVTSVKVRGEEGAYHFTVGIRSPDEGCDQYADWWEIVDEDGVLIYRRILLHSHVEEQPFERSGGPVDVEPDAALWIRAHMHPGGYGGQAFHGTVRRGFRPADLDAFFAANLAEQPPLPDGCGF